jgi:hypothetical protein
MGAFEGQTHIFFGGGQDRIFKKVLLFAHAVVTFRRFRGGAIFLRISPPGGEYPRNIAPQWGEYPRNIAPFRIFAPSPHIYDVVYSNNFVILSSYKCLTRLRI